MVDVGHKKPTHRVAVAESRVKLAPETRQVLATGTAKKGDVLATARLAGILAAKKTAELIPLCHTIPLSHVSIDVSLTDYGARVVARS